MRELLNTLKPYSKAIAAGVGYLVAFGVVVARGDDPEAIEPIAAALIGVFSTLAVYLVPNTPG